MRNFLRALKFAWTYRKRFICSSICALLAAVFWSLNFTAIFPVLKVLSSDQNLQEWAQASIQNIKKSQIEPLENNKNDLKSLHDKIQTDIDDINSGKKEVPQEKLDVLKNDLRHADRDLARVEQKLEAARTQVYGLQNIKKYLDRFFPTGKFDTLVLVIALTVLGFMMRGFFETIQESLVGSVVGLAQFDIRNLFFRKAIHFDLAQFSQAGTADVMSRFTGDVEALGGGMKILMGRVVAEPLRAIGCIIVACFISWRLTLSFLILVPIAAFLLASVARMMKRATRRLLEKMSSIFKILQETFYSIRIVKAFCRESHARKRFRDATLEYHKKMMWMVNLDAISGPIIEVLGVLTICAALLAGAYLVLEKRTDIFGIQFTESPMEMESLLQLYVLLASISDPVRKLSNVYTKLQTSEAAAERLFHYLDMEPKILTNPAGTLLPRHQESIEFQNICFSYKPGHPILTGVDLTVRHGEKVALVGQNGCGKSTLLNLLPRFFEPDHGTILIDGIDIRTANLRSLRKQIALVTQDTILFDETVFHNIAYSKPKATRQQVEAASKKAQAHELILSLPQGYDTRVGEGGKSLSGGQCQRISLARAILADPSILILDEFTSQTDSIAEMEIHKILKEFMQGRTTFLITHRLNTLENVDRIVVIDHHQIIAVGTHAELMKICPLYQRLQDAHTSQRKAA